MAETAKGSTTTFGIDDARLVSLVDGLHAYGLPETRMVQVLVDEFGMDPPVSDAIFQERLLNIRKSMEKTGEKPEFKPDSQALTLVLANVMRRQTDVKFPKQRSPRPLRSSRTTPDYSRLRRYDATAEDLAIARVGSVDELVEKANASARFSVSQFDFPSTRKKFYALVRRVAQREQATEDDSQ